MQTSPKTSPKKYRLGNQPEEYELVTAYLGYLPEGLKDWFAHAFLTPLIADYSKKEQEIVIVNPENPEEKIALVFRQVISRAAFPLEFYGEERAMQWNHFGIVAKKDKPSEHFIIPLH